MFFKMISSCMVHRAKERKGSEPISQTLGLTIESNYYHKVFAKIGASIILYNCLTKSSQWPRFTSSLDKKRTILMYCSCWGLGFRFLLPLVWVILKRGKQGTCHLIFRTKVKLHFFKEGSLTFSNCFEKNVQSYHIEYRINEAFLCLVKEPLNLSES